MLGISADSRTFISCLSANCSVFPVFLLSDELVSFLSPPEHAARNMLRTSDSTKSSESFDFFTSRPPFSIILKNYYILYYTYFQQIVHYFFEFNLQISNNFYVNITFSNDII